MRKVSRLSFFTVALIGYLFIPSSSYGPQLEIYALDVGQGDSTLIVTPLGQRILIDGGRNSMALEKIDHLIPFWDREIDAVMLSHPDADHVTGLIEIISRFKVGRVFFNRVEIESKAYMAFIEKVDSQRIKTEKFVEGTVIRTSDGITIEGLWPNKDSLISASSNDTSQVGLIKYRGFSGLFTGDIDTEVANQIADKFTDINYLKVPHHGSKYNLTSNQLYTLAPEVSTVSVGEDNNYGHPSAEAMRNLKMVNSRIYRTDLDGTIKIVVNQAGISVSSE